MNKKLLINNSRFKLKKNINHPFKNFYLNFIVENYNLEITECLCKSSNNSSCEDIYISLLDRWDIEFPTVICNGCGLIRAKNYFKEKNVIDFYENHYRKLLAMPDDYVEPEKFFDRQIIEGKRRFNLISKYSEIKHNHKILDLGGGTGGNLMNFKQNTENLYLADYFDPYLDYAKSKNIDVIKGGLESVDFKPDVIILSHVIEHWSDFKSEIQNLINIQKPNETLNYIEFPGVDSLKRGRREGDFLQDIHYPHVYYFSSYVFENIMNRYGFEKIYLDSEIKSIFVFTGIKKPLINYFERIKKDLIKAEFTRKKYIIKNSIKKLIPEKLLEIRRSILNKNKE